MICSLSIIVKMTSVGILTYISRINRHLTVLKQNNLHLSYYEQLQFRTQLRLAYTFLYLWTSSCSLSSSAKRVSKMTECKTKRAKISHIKEKRNLKKQSVIMGFPIGNLFVLDLFY